MLLMLSIIIITSIKIDKHLIKETITFIVASISKKIYNKYIKIQYVTN